MESISKTLRLLADANRVRLLLLLAREELSVAELQEILGKGQSQISTHLSQLKQAGLVEDRRTGKNIFYSLKQAPSLAKLLEIARAESEEEVARDAEALRLVLRKRKDKMRSHFDSLAGKFRDASTCPDGPGKVSPKPFSSCSRRPSSRIWAPAKAPSLNS